MGWRSWAGVAALFAGALGVRLFHLASSSWPTGTDGYYYVVQTQDFVHLGHLHVPDASWALRLLALPHLLGLDALLSVKVGAALLAALVVPAAWAAGRALAPERVAAAWALAAWMAASPVLTHLAAEFPKSLAIAAPGLALVALLAWRGPAWRWAGVVLAALALATAHRLGAALLILGVVGALAGLGLRWLRSGERPRIPAWAWGAGLGVAILLVVASLALPAVLHPADLERLGGQLTWGGPSPWAYLPLSQAHSALFAELALSWLGLVAAAWVGWRHPRHLPATLGLALPLAACILVPWRRDVLDLGWRLALVSPLLAAPLAALAAGLLPRTRVPAFVVPALFLAPLVSPLGYDHDSSPPYAAWSELVERIPRPLPELLIVHQGVAFLYDHQTGHEAMSWAPEPELDRARVGRLVVGLSPRHWVACGRPELPAPVWLEGGYAYLREDAWEVVWACASEDEDLALPGEPRNPTRVRPASMLRNR